MMIVPVLFMVISLPLRDCHSVIETAFQDIDNTDI